MQEIERDVDAYIKSHQPKVGRGSRGEWSDLEIAERDLYIFLCHYIDGVTVGQLAETLDINATTVRHTLSSVMGRMQSKVIDYERKLEERKAAGL
jgi:FixJ family two-component response regulator